MSNIIHVTDGDFQNKVLESDVPVLVDFWAEWCGPCKAIGPILEELSVEFDGKITIAKVDVDSNQKIPMQYGIRSIPTLIIFKNGNIEGTKVGSVSKSLLTEFINSAI